MFNRENIAQAQADFAEKRYCHIDNILEERYIQALYKEVPNMPYGVWGCIRNSHNKYPAGFQNSEKFAGLQAHIEKAEESLVTFTMLIGY